MTQGKIVADTAPVLAALDSIKRQAADQSDPVRTVLSIGLDAARAGAPVRTGELVGRITVLDVTATGGEIAARAPYSWAQEYGTRYVRGRRFMARGAEAMQAAAEPVYTKWLDSAVERAAR